MFFANISLLSGQTDIRLLNTGSGLADETVRALYLHPNGMLYIGTSVGLSVYDGENIVNISTALRQEVKNIIPHGSDSLILIRDNAISVINIFNYGYRETDYNAIYANKFVYGVKAGNALFCATNDGLVKIEIAGLTYENISDKYPEIPDEMIYPVARCIAYSETTNYIYLGHRNGLLVWDISKNKIVKKEALSAFDGRPVKDLNCKSGQFYFIAEHGQVCRFNESTDELRVFPIKAALAAIEGDDIFYVAGSNICRYQINSGLSDSMFIDKKFNLFQLIKTGRSEFAMATRAGVLIAKRAEPGVKEMTVAALTSEKKYLELQQKVAFGSRLFFNRRSGISELDTITGVTRFHKIPTELVGEMLNIIPYRYKQVLVAGYHGYCGFDLSTGKYFRLKLFSPKMDSIIAGIRIITGNYDSAAGSLILCPYRHPVIIKDLKSGKETTWNGNDRKWFRTVRSLHYLGNHEYLFGANGNDGLIRINLKSGQGRYYPAAAFSQAGNNSAIINQILPFAGVFYLATADGLVRFEPVSGKLSAVQLDGLPYHDQVYAMSVINGQLFATTRNALCKLSSELEMVRLYTFENYSGAGIPFFLKNEVKFYVNDKLISMRIPDWSDTSYAYISHIGAGDAWQFVGHAAKWTLDYGAGSLQVLFGSKNFVRNQGSLVIKYRFSGSAEWQLLKGSSFQTGNLDYGVHEIEYYSIYLGKKSPVKRFVLEVRRPWWASYWFYGSCVLICLLLIYAFLKWKLKQKDQREREQLSLMLHASETERSRISREFHDGVGTRLSTVKLIAEGSRAGQNSGLLEKLPEIVDEIIVDVRNIINELSPQSLKQYGLPFALKSHVHGLAGQLKNIDIELVVSEDFPRLDEHTEINVFRIFQELIANAVKHSEGHKINVSLSNHDDVLKLIVSDNGKGINRESGHTGFGMGNIKSRVLALNGELSIAPAEPQGTEVKIVLPLRR